MTAPAFPDLTFPGIDRGPKAKPWDLAILLYRGGAAAKTRQVAQLIQKGRLGRPLRTRLGLVIRIHEAIHGRLVSGGSIYSADNSIRWMRYLFRWADKMKLDVNLQSIQRVYLEWTDDLVHQYRVTKDLTQRSAYTLGAQAGQVLDCVLNRGTPLIASTRLQMPPVRKAALGVKAEKQNLAETFVFGRLLQDMCDALTVDTVLNASLPVCIPLQQGGELRVASRIRAVTGLESDGTLRTRGPLANKRIEAELLMFIAQTGMNFAQTHKLKLRHFSYASYLDGYVVRDRKARRGGEVLFEIFQEYKAHFERYLEWRRRLFPGSDLLFPFVRRGRPLHMHPQFTLRHTCRRIGVRFVPPQELRNTRVNWLLRRSNDVDLTATMAQHTRETLLHIYERPSQQRAISEVIRFWNRHDPTLLRTSPPAPGECDGKATASALMPIGAQSPDCIRASGCLWCDHHRDIDNQDHLWALASFRHLKVIEESKWRAPQSSRDVSAARLAIERISEKLRWFRDSNQRRKGWFEEALARIEEGNHHPEWAGRIAAMEGGP